MSTYMRKHWIRFICFNVHSQEKFILECYSILGKARQKYQKLRNSGLEMLNWEETLYPFEKYCILIKEGTGECYEKKNFLKKLTPPYVDQPNSFFNADIGTLYEKAPDEKEPNNKSLIGLVSIEKSDNYIYIP